MKTNRTLQSRPHAPDKSHEPVQVRSLKLNQHKLIGFALQMDVVLTVFPELDAGRQSEFWAVLGPAGKELLLDEPVKIGQIDTAVYRRPPLQRPCSCPAVQHPVTDAKPCYACLNVRSHHHWIIDDETEAR